MIVHPQKSKRKIKMVNYEKISLLLNLECIALWVAVIFSDSSTVNLLFEMFAFILALFTVIEYGKR